MADLSQDGAKNYTYDLATQVGQLRMVIRDIPSNGNAFYSDQELQFLLDQATGSVNIAAINALENWARHLATQPKIYVGDYQEDPTVAAKSLMVAAKNLRETVGYEMDDAVVGVGGGSLYLTEDDLCSRIVY